MGELSLADIEAALFYEGLDGMHLLEQRDGETVENLEKVCANVTSFSKLTIEYLYAIGYGKEAGRKITGLTSTFRLILKCCVDTTEGEISVVMNQKYVEILGDLESVLVDTAFNLHGDTVQLQGFTKFEQMLGDKDLRSKLSSEEFRVIISNTTTPWTSDLIITEVDLVLELLHNYTKSEYGAEMENILMKFLQFFKDYWMINNHENLPELLECVEAVIHKIMTKWFYYIWSDEHHSPADSDIWKDIIKALILVQSGIFSPPSPFTDELFTGYVKCIQLILIEVQSHCPDACGGLKIFDNMQEDLLKFCIGCTKHYCKQEQLSDLRVKFQTLMMNLGFIINSSLENGYQTKIGEKVSLWLYDFLVAIIDALLPLLHPSPPLSHNLLMEFMDYFSKFIEPIIVAIINEKKRELAKAMAVLMYKLVVESNKATLSHEDSGSPDELLKLSLQSVRNVLVWLLKEDGENNLDDLLEILHHELPFLVHLLINYRKHYTKCDNLPNIRLHFQRLGENFTSGVSPGLYDMLLRILKVLAVQLDSSPPLTSEHVAQSMDSIKRILTALIKDGDTTNWMDLVLQIGGGTLGQSLGNAPGAVANRVALEPFVQAPNEGRDIVAEGNTIIREACKWSPELARKNQLRILTDLYFIQELLRNRHSYIEPEKLSDCKIQFQAMVRDFSSLIYSSFNNEISGIITATLMTNNLIEKITDMKVHFAITPSKIVKRLRQKYLYTDSIGFLHFLLRDVEELIACKSYSFMVWKDQFKEIYNKLVFFSSFLPKVTPSSSSYNDASQALSIRIRNDAYELEYLLCSPIVGALSDSCRSTLISDLIQEIKISETYVLEANSNPIRGINIDVSSPTLAAEATGPSKYHMLTNDVVVGFDKEINLLMHQLTSSSKDRNLLSISGMPGLGKTTLVRKVYDHPYIFNHFRYRAWCCVSQDYNKRKVLLTILGCVARLSDNIHTKSDEDISVMLHKELVGRRYLIVMDDVWVEDVFEELQLFFPNNGNGSRLILTSRDKLVGSLAEYHLELGLLTKKLSWDLLKQVYRKEKCPSGLYQVGKEIAKRCNGLPLAIVVVGGLLATSDKKPDFWNQVARNLPEHLNSEQHGMEALGLSYQFLPEHLKPLFLYLGAFPEDKVLSAETLKWLWVAEGFAHKTHGNKSSEEKAEIYLMELTHRNLLMVSERRFDGRVKTVRMHDLLREMSIRKAVEEKFLQHINVCGESLPDPIYCSYRVSISLKILQPLQMLTLILMSHLLRIKIFKHFRWFLHCILFYTSTQSKISHLVRMLLNQCFATSS